MIPHEHCNCCENESKNHEEEYNSKYEQVFDMYNLHLHDEIEQEEAKKIISSKSAENNTTEVLKFLFGCIEVTSLKTTDNEDNILKLVERINEFTNSNPDIPYPAGICIYPKFVNIVNNSLETENINISSVTGGFPSSQTFLDIKTIETSLAIQDGATEIDMVMPVGFFLAKDYEMIETEISEIKQVCGENIRLKVILETGALQTAVNIKKAALLAIYSGADFIKTSTGKISVGATPMAVYVMCKTIKEYYEKTNIKIGIKIAGGISTTETALEYYTIVKEVLGKEWLTHDLFRIGTSNLSNAIISKITGSNTKVF